MILGLQSPPEINIMALNCSDETVKVTQHTNDQQKLILCQSVGLL